MYLPLSWKSLMSDTSFTAMFSKCQLDMIHKVLSSLQTDKLRSYRWCIKDSSGQITTMNIYSLHRLLAQAKLATECSMKCFTSCLVITEHKTIMYIFFFHTFSSCFKSQDLWHSVRFGKRNQSFVSIPELFSESKRCESLVQTLEGRNHGFS